MRTPAPRLLSLWRKYKPDDEINEYIKIYINEDPFNVHKVLGSYVHMAYPMVGSGLPHKGDFERDEYNNMAYAFDPSIIYSFLKTIYGNELDSEEYPALIEDPTKRIASQFVWMHKKVQSEKKKNDDEDFIKP